MADGKSNSNLLLESTGGNTASTQLVYNVFSDDTFTTSTSKSTWRRPHCIIKSVPRIATLTGKVVDGDLSLADTKVTLKAGDIEYYGTTDAEGAYKVTVLQPDHEFDCAVTADGYRITGDASVSFSQALEQIADFQAYRNFLPFIENQAAAVILPDVTAKPAGTFYEFQGLDKGKLIFKVLPGDPIANVPYLFVPSATSIYVQGDETGIPAEAGSVTKDGITFSGTYQAHALTDGERAFSSFSVSQAAKAAADAAAYVPGMEAYFSIPAATEVSGIELRNTPTGIEDTVIDAGTDGHVRYFNLQGVRVADPTAAPGMYIRVDAAGKATTIMVR